MIRFMFHEWLWFDPGSPDRMPVAVRSAPSTARATPNENPALAAGEIRFPLEE
jgi:hypothetical protein